MKKQIYVAVTVFVLFAFLLVIYNSFYAENFGSGYSFKRSLATNAGNFREGFTELQSSPVETQFQTIVPYLDNARGAQCAGVSNGLSATGGPLCLTQDQQIAMASRGMNSNINTCQPIVQTL